METRYLLVSKRDRLSLHHEIVMVRLLTGFFIVSRSYFKTLCLTS